DSWNSILFHDGRVARGPIATCEIQGYAYDARVRLARLAREVWGDAALADRLDRDAAALRERFNRDYWIEERRQYALALDGDKHQVDAMSSNVGHLLWSGIMPDDRAATLVTRLMSAEMFTGWGIRTMSAEDAGYNPIEYHNGTVWPHDTAFAAEGMRRYGHREQASHLALMLIQAAAAFEYRLPEVFAGFAARKPGRPSSIPPPRGRRPGRRAHRCSRFAPRWAWMSSRVRCGSTRTSARAGDAFGWTTSRSEREQQRPCSADSDRHRFRARFRICQD